MTAARFTLRVGENAVEYTVTLHRAEGNAYSFEAKAVDETIMGTVDMVEVEPVKWRAMLGLRAGVGTTRYAAIRELVENLCAG